MKKIIALLMVAAVIGTAVFSQEPAAPTSWTPAQGVGLKTIAGIAYGNGTFLAAGYNDKPENVIFMSSKDGITWTQAKPKYTFDGFRINRVSFGNGKFIISGLRVKEGTVAIYDSADLILWTWAVGNPGPVPSNNSAIGFAYGKNKEGKDIGVAVFGNSIYYTPYSSRTGTVGNWTKSNLFYIGSNRQNTWGYDFRGVFYDGTRFIAYENGGRGLWSTDGLSWRTGDGVIPSPIQISRNPITRMVSSGSKFIGVGPDNTLGWSADGITWTPSDNKGELRGGDLNAVAYGSGIFVAGNSRGKIIYSSDGFEWTQVSSSTFGDTNIRDVVYGNGRFVAIGDNGRIAYSNTVE